MSVVRSSSELAGPFVFMAILQKQRWWIGPHGRCMLSLQSKETTLRPPKATSQLSVSVSGIYLLGNKMNLFEVLSVQAALGRQFLP